MRTEVKHTPGPWALCQANDGRMSIRAGIDGDDSVLSLAAFQRDADARLIAAAPELLEALQAILNVEGAAIAGSRLGAWQGLDAKYHFDKVRAAIAKAEGQRP